MLLGLTCFLVVLTGCQKDPNVAYIQGIWSYEDLHLKPIVGEQHLITRWIFDVEILARFALGRGGLGLPDVKTAIYEMPLPTWHDVAGTRIRVRDFLRAPLDILRIWWAYGPVASFMKDLPTLWGKKIGIAVPHSISTGAVITKKIKPLNVIMPDLTGTPPA